MLKVFLLICTLVLLTACSRKSIDTGLSELIAEGIIVNPNIANIQPASPNLTQAVQDSVTQVLSIPVNFYFPRNYTLSFERESMGQHNEFIRALIWEHGQFSGMGDVGFNHIVNEGDFLAKLTIDPPQTLLIDIMALELERDTFETSFSENRQARLQEIENMRIQIETTTDDERRIIALSLERAQLQYQQFINSANNSRAIFESRMDALTAPIETERLYSPVFGVVTFITPHLRPGLFRNIPYAPHGSNIRNIISVSCLDYVHFLANAPLFALRYGDIVPIMDTQTDIHFYAMVATDPMTFGIAREGTHQVRLVPLEGEYERFLADFESQTDGDGTVPRLVAQPVVPLIENSILVDSRAVIVENMRHYVTVYNNGVLGKRYITPGLRTGSGPGAQIQILSGLEAGQWVVIP